VTAAARKIAPRPRPLAVFTARCEARAKLWRAGEFGLHHAVDELQHAAVRDGLVAELGQDRVQEIMCEAFAPVRDDLLEFQEIETDAAACAVETTFAAACAAADEKQARKPQDPRLDRLRRLMDADVSLERAWNEINTPGDVPTATLRAAEYLIQQGDAERFRKWLDRHSAHERNAIRRHLEAKRCH
jgi:hypothetical protein